MSLITELEKPTILLQGSAGSGKTSFACRFPKVGLVNMDHNLNGPIKVLRGENRLDLIEAAKVTSTRTSKDGKILKTPDQWDRMCEIIVGYCNDPEIETIVIDSLSVYKNILCAFILDRYPNKSGSKQMEIQSWGIFEQLTQTILMQLRSVNKFKIFTGHEYLHEGDDKISRTQLLLPGKSRDLLPALATDVLRMTVKQTIVGGKQKSSHWCSSAQSEKLPGLKHTFDLPVEFEATQANLDKILAQFKD